MEQYDKQIDKALSELTDRRQRERFTRCTNIWMISGNSDLVLNGNTACAAGLYSGGHVEKFSNAFGGVVALAVSIPIMSDNFRFNQEYEPARKHFYNWLLNESVFKDCTYCRDVDKALTRGFVVFKADSPKRLLLEVVRWVRMTYENGLDIVQNYYELITRGVHPALASNFAYAVRAKEKLFIDFWWNDSHQAGGSRMLSQNKVFSFYSGKVQPDNVWDGKLSLPAESQTVFNVGVHVQGFDDISTKTLRGVKVVKATVNKNKGGGFFDLELFKEGSLNELKGVTPTRNGGLGNGLSRCFDNLAEFINNLEELYLKPLLKGSE